MKVLFISRSTLFSGQGGDTVQMMKTAEHLRKLGIDVDIRRCDERIDYAPYDLLHFFNLIRPADILVHIFRSGKPYAVSPIFVDYAEFDARIRTGQARLVFRYLPADWIEYLKVLGRRLHSGERIVSTRYLVWGHRRSVRYIIRHARCLLPNSHSEYRRLVAHFGLEQQYRVVPNAVETGLFVPPAAEGDRDPRLVLCVGRIEGIKNQMGLIRALNDSPYSLCLIGSPAPNQPAYHAACQALAAQNIRFIPQVSQEELVRYYAAAGIHVLPSWFETTGLSSLEAAAMGCRVVITDKGDTREYFGDEAVYCDPASPESIRDAVDRAASGPPPEGLARRIRERFTWERAAAETAAAYQAIVSSPFPRTAAGTSG
ncbi:MAG TPA: glycosyltransferase family 4 protein [Puia sp.]|nr:glycosyltransferase family 4 protein [Puia sp.]